MYATGGTHPVRRWQRNLTAHVPDFSPEDPAWQERPDGSAPKQFNACWQYQLLHSWLEQQKITRQQATKIIWSALVEVLFDVTQAMEVTYELKPEPSMSAGLVLTDIHHALAEAERQWKAWQAAKIGNLSPNGAPAIKQPEQLQESISEGVYQMLNQLLEGQQTLRDLAIKMKRDVLTLTRYLLPYIQLGLVELINIPDLPRPMFSTLVVSAPAQPLIVCVDDSPLICRILGEMLSSVGYRFIAVNDPLKAIGVISATRPDLILLDLMMPDTDGYEICGKLRKLSVFRHTPILILTSSDGLFDRVKAKIVGSTGFLSKAAVDAEIILGTVRKHLRHCTLNSSLNSKAMNQLMPMNDKPDVPPLRLIA
jgi:chemotaxis family two-component system response regulator PixG